jgi:glycosyltransferase involved in cell wall biosynthesis
MSSAGPELSVVVCTHNGEQRLPAALSRLRDQTLDSARYEVIVVDDGSTDRTSELARAAGAHVVRLEAKSGLAAARNAGVRAARGSIVAFTDDDCEPESGWLAAVLVAFGDALVEGAGGAVVPACANPVLLRYLRERNPLSPLSAELLAGDARRYRLRLYLRNVLGHRPALGIGERLYSPVGANMAFRRALLLELGGFDETFTFGGEEEELCRRGHRRARGLVLVYEPRAVVVHRFAPRAGDPLRRARAYGRGYARTRLRHPELKVIVYPFPLLTALVAALALACRRRSLLALSVAVPPSVYGRWQRAARRSRSPAPLAFAYLELCEELWTMAGELEGQRAYRSRR